ncbi:hypothetical protein ZIOFF_036178 [Zingiber officinale]|uniref:UDP-N-acetylglucosamine--dolichyl-phosphate N-acetylglucosaminephosphotransferase n=1 Tax=Zingiber officinale TaxID=94328 RepID=A0A8J5GHU3_ZINOF|nr:hypothetical protein ZIOFF_036178 [Zingiber officinale]
MATRRKPSSKTVDVRPPISAKENKPLPVEDPPLAPPKLGIIVPTAAAFFLPFFYLVFVHYQIEPELRRSISISAAMSFGAFVVALRMIPVAARYVLRRNLFGFDINKKGTQQGAIKVPESLGIVIGFVYLVVAILFQHFNFTSDSNLFGDGDQHGHWLVEYNAALASICFMILLGFVDDVLDLPWRVKLVLPSFATLPLLMAYAGHTTIIIPKPLIQYVGVAVLDLDTVWNAFRIECWIYKLYMGMLAVFCTNSINIHAGLNGLEAGQTVVISAAVLIHNVMQIGASTNSEYQQAHAFSIYLVLPLLATSLALLSYNWYPSSVFVGDTYTYFAGMALAVVGILGHFSETLLLFFLPQVLNFLYSCPQLFKIIPCPRHRLPKFDLQTGLLTGTKDGTLVNLFLRLFGRCTEKMLCIRLLIFQVSLWNCGFVMPFLFLAEAFSCWMVQMRLEHRTWKIYSCLLTSRREHDYDNGAIILDYFMLDLCEEHSKGVSFDGNDHDAETIEVAVMDDSKNPSGSTQTRRGRTSVFWRRLANVATAKFLRSMSLSRSAVADKEDVLAIGRCR